MCGIPMPPPADCMRGRKLTLEQALRHAGGEDNLISDSLTGLIQRTQNEYIWKYPGRAVCSACKAELGDLKMRHGTTAACPACGREATFRHEGRGHKKLIDQFVAYEWRKSAVEPQAVVLVGVQVERDQCGPKPELAETILGELGLYVFRDGEPVTVCRRRVQYYTGARYWEIIMAPDVTPVHNYGNTIAIDRAMERAALENTRIGRVVDRLSRAARRTEALELTAVANAARRPYLEHLIAAGQEDLAAELMYMRNVPRAVIPKPNGRRPTEVLGLTEGQWYQARKEGIRMSAELLKTAHALQAAGLGDIPLRELVGHEWRWTEVLLGDGMQRKYYHNSSVAELLRDAPEKLRKKALRRIFRAGRHVHEWRDYYKALYDLGEDMGNSTLILPRPDKFKTMHDRKIEEIRQLWAERERLRDAEAKQAFDERIKRLRKRYGFSEEGLVLQPYDGPEALTAEGKALDICIGGYWRSYRDGHCVLCSLREQSAPDQPFRAVELDPATMAVRQDRGYKNDIVPGSVPEALKQRLDRFWAAFRKAKVRRKSA